MVTSINLWFLVLGDSYSRVNGNQYTDNSCLVTNVCTTVLLAVPTLQLCTVHHGGKSPHVQQGGYLRVLYCDNK